MCQYTDMEITTQEAREMTASDRMRNDRQAREAAEYQRRVEAALRGEYGEKVREIVEKSLAK